MLYYRAQVFKDSRGYFFESFNQNKFNELIGKDIDFVQDNESFSSKGVLRGLHFQTGEYAQAKLVRVVKGTVLDVVVDMRKESPTFSKHFSIELSEDNKRQLFVPRGFAHGFIVLSETAIFPINVIIFITRLQNKDFGMTTLLWASTGDYHKRVYCFRERLSIANTFKHNAMMNVLVTGSNGQLASCIKDLAKQYEELNFIYTDYQELDICDLKQVNTFFKSNPKIDYCINCAAYTAVDKAETEVEKAFEINAQGAKNLAIVCNEFDAILIQISTDFVFDGEKNEPYLKQMFPNP